MTQNGTMRHLRKDQWLVQTKMVLEYVFMTTTDLDWTKFNVLTVNDVSFLERMKKNAQTYVDRVVGKTMDYTFTVFH